MGIFDSLFNINSSKKDPFVRNAIDYGSSKKNGGHDHRTNKGEDRTPSQKNGDEKRTKS